MTDKQSKRIESGHDAHTYPYHGDDDYLGECLRRMNRMTEDELSQLAVQLRRSLANNFELFGRYAFRKHGPDQERRSSYLFSMRPTGM